MKASDIEIGAVYKTGVDGTSQYTIKVKAKVLREAGPNDLDKLPSGSRVRRSGHKLWVMEALATGARKWRERVKQGDSRVRTHKEETGDFEDAPDFIWDELERFASGDRDTMSRPFIDYAFSFFTVERVALTGEQVVERQVITAPPKASDSRTAGFVERNWETVEALGTEDISAQLEALTPAELRELVSGVIEDHLDTEVYQDVLDEERGVRKDLAERLA